MKVTVWGGSGFLGSYVSDFLSESGHQVIVADKKKSPWIKDNQEMFIGDILKFDDVLESIHKSDYVFNFAGMANINESNENPQESAENNVIGNINLLESCKKSKELKTYVFASSIYVYSNSGGFYRCSKQACESYIEEYNRQHNLPFLILRFGSLYGLRTNETNGIYKYLKDAVSKGSISYAGDQNARREYIHVEDAAKICVDLINKEIKNEFFTLTGTQSISIKDLTTLISEIIGKDIKFKFKDLHSNDNSHYQITPYKFINRKSKKYTLPVHIDLGEGLLEIIQDIKNIKD